MFVFVKQAIAKLFKTGLAPDPLLNGDDLIAIGVPPTSALGTILDAVYDAQLEGGICSKEDAISLAKVIADLLDHWSETLSEFVLRRHKELQRSGIPNRLAYSQIREEVSRRRFMAEPLSERQVRRLLYG